MATVCFDLDDTLYREWDFVASGYRSVAALLAADSDPSDASRYLELISARRPVGFEAAIDELYPVINGRPCPYTVDALIEHYRAHTPDISLRPGVADMLCALADAGHRLMLITDGSTRHQRSKIRALGLTRFFAPADILISEETGGDKTTTVPWAAAERTARRSTGTNSRSDLWYIGDNMAKDFRLPGMRGWHTVMLMADSGNVFAQRPLDWPAENRPQCTITHPGLLPDMIK